MTSQSSLLNFFDHTYIINLPERSDRREEMTQELKALGWNTPCDRVTFFPAIKPSDSGGFGSIGVRGCFLSHLAILKEAQKQNLGNLLIMEDDLSFTRLLIEQQDATVHELEALTWDIAYLGHGLTFIPQRKGIFQVHPPEELRLAHFLAFNQRTIEPLIGYLEAILGRPPGHPDGGPMHVDGAYSRFRAEHLEFTTIIANPSLGYQRASPSSIAGYKWFDTVPVLAQLAGSGRKMKNWYQRNFR